MQRLYRPLLLGAALVTLCLMALAASNGPASARVALQAPNAPASGGARSDAGSSRADVARGLAPAPPRTPTRTAVPPTLTRTAVPPTLTATAIPPTLTRTAVPPTLTRTAVPPTLTRTAIPPTTTPTVVPPTLTRTAVPPTLTATAIAPTFTATATSPGGTATRTSVPPSATAPAATATRTSLPPSATRTAGPTATPCNITFSDVHPTDYFYTPVLYLACHGVVSGYADGTFRPYNNTTRSQMVKIVVLGFAITPYAPPGGGYTFADVPPANPFFSYIETAAHNNIVSGYTCGADPSEPCDSANRPYFRPYANVTRGQLSKIVVVAAGWTQINPPVQSFQDVFPNTAFYTFVETAYCHGIISGYSCGGPGEPCGTSGKPYFRQFNDATRGQIAKIVYGALTSTQTCATP
jgi:hypothetical protein